MIRGLKHIPSRKDVKDLDSLSWRKVTDWLYEVNKMAHGMKKLENIFSFSQNIRSKGHPMKLEGDLEQTNKITFFQIHYHKKLRLPPTLMALNGDLLNSWKTDLSRSIGLEDSIYLQRGKQPKIQIRTVPVELFRGSIKPKCLALKEFSVEEWNQAG